ncbi:hypothetical protein PV326_007038 [Microctonus aethiopoides]|nr:hypothetical protein PV326_007038 [Microctonus aethiopoides]
MSLLRIVIASRNTIRNNEVTRDIPWKYIFRTKGKLINTIKREFNINAKKFLDIKPNNNQRNIKNCFTRLSLGGLGFSSLWMIKHFHHSVKCEALAEQTLNEFSETNQPGSIEWSMLIKYLLPHFAFVVAILNIWIPQCVGHVVNVITKVRKEGKNGFDDSTIMTSIFQQLAAPAFSLAREIVSRLTTDIQDFKSSFKIIISQGLRSLTQVVGCVISVIIISPQLTGVMVLCMPTVIFVGSLIGRSLRKLSSEAQNQIAKSTAVCEEAIQNIRTVRAFAAEEKEMEFFELEVEQAATLYERLGLGIGLFQAGTNLFLNGILLSTLYFGGHLMSSGQLSPGDLMAFLMATQTIQRSLAQMSLLFGTYVRGVSAGARIFEYLKMPPSPMMVNGKNIDDVTLAGSVEFKNVTFNYPTRPDFIVLNDFNLNIPAGTSVGIVGSSGNGKSTVATLLERMYDVNDGSINIDGIDIRTLNSSDLRGKVLGYIDQEPVLFSTTIMENIRYGQTEASDAEVIEVAKEANAHEFISSFPDGYYTQVGERGAQLSGGQKQRIAIARALLKKPSILILDEATSALDYESERVVQKALESAMKGRTVFIIAHRLSTVKDADVIVVLKRGAIVEMGSHSELIQKRGAYFDLVNREENQQN